MNYHVLGTHPQLGRLLSASYGLQGAQAARDRWTKGVETVAFAGWAYRVVKCLAPSGSECICGHDDIFPELS